MITERKKKKENIIKKKKRDWDSGNMKESLQRPI